LIPRQFIFVAAPARSGTKYIASLFSALYHDNPSTKAFHEPQPAYAPWIEKVCAGADPKSFWKDEKLQSIAAQNCRIYFEASHFFLIEFDKALSDLGIHYDLIIHRRPYRDICLSMLRLNDIPGRSKRGLTYYIHPVSSICIHKLGPVWTKLSDYQLIYWYTLEMASRAKRCGERVLAAGGKVVLSELARLSDESYILGLCNILGMPKPTLDGLQKYKTIKDRKINHKNLYKNMELMLPDNVEEQEAEVCSILGLT